MKVCLCPPLNPEVQTRFTDTAVILVNVLLMTGEKGRPTVDLSVKNLVYYV